MHSIQEKPQISNLDELKKYLGSLNNDGSKEINTNQINFCEKTYVRKLFDLIHTEYILTVGPSQIENKELKIEAKGENINNSIIFYFYDIDGILCVDLEEKMMGEVELFSNISNVKFHDLTNCYYYNPSTEYYDLIILTDVELGDFKKKVQLHIPPFKGEYRLKLQDSEKNKKLNDEELNSLFETGKESFKDENFINHITLSEFNLAYDPEKKRVSFYSLELKYTNEKWNFFGDKIAIKNISLQFNHFNPFSDNSKIQIVLEGIVKIGNTAVAVGGIFPDGVLYANLANNKVIKVSEVATFFEIELPYNFSTTTISKLGFVIDKSKNVSFEFAIKNINIVDQLSLEEIYFKLEKKGGNLIGELYANFKIGDTTTVYLRGKYNGDGNYSLKGGISNLELDEFCTFIEEKTDIVLSDFIKDTKLQTVDVSYEKNGKQISIFFKMKCSLEKSDPKPMEFNLKLSKT